jgi:lysophospholipase L1-like esterase
MAYVHNCRLSSKLNSHCLAHGTNGIPPNIARQIKHLQQTGQNKTKLAAYHGIRPFTYDLSTMLIRYIGASRIDRAKPSLRIMPLGGSVTYGSESTDGNGYRRILQEILMSDGYNVKMIGSRKSGSMENNDNEGWRGFRIDQITNKAKISVPRFLPNIFTVNAGSNDCVQNFEIETAGERMSDMLEYLWTASSGSTVVLSTLIPNLDREIEARVRRANEQFREMAKVKAAEGRKIIFVDIHGSDGPMISDLADGTHPNDVGYAKMAMIWRRGIHEAVYKGFV